MAADGFQKTLWVTLVACLVAVGAAYFVSESRRVDLPVIGELEPFTLTNQLGRAVTTESLRGEVLVADVIFSRCPTQCHWLSQQMGRLQSQLPSGVRLLSLTADPVYDTPEMLTSYGKRYGSDPAKWWFLTGSKAEVYRAATNSFLFSVMESAEPEKARLEDLFIHSADFKIVDKLGRLRAVVYGEETNAVERVLGIVKQLRRETNL